MHIVSVQNVSKTYKGKSEKALNNISFNVNEGVIFGLIGPDGAGKSTLFRMLTTLLLPDTGSIFINGNNIIHDYIKIRESVGYMPGKFSLYQDLTVEENLYFFATIFNTSIQKNYDLIKEIYIQLEPFRDRRAGKLSGGMKQKLALCCALIHRPKILFLDEPTTGVDTVSRKEFWEMLKRLKNLGITILVSTPYMDEATLCDSIALIQNGKILSIETPLKITQSFGEPLYQIKAENQIQLMHDLKNNIDIKTCYSFGEYLHITFKNNALENQIKLNNYLLQLNHQNIDCTLITAGIEDCFIKLMHE
jgi:ABC-2 type transport system ATP-binding protein